jgi:hypothetical protein
MVKTVMPEEDLLIVRLVLLRVMLRPVAEVLLVRVRVPLNPRRLLTVTVAVALDEGPVMVTTPGLGDRAKSGPGIEQTVKGELTAGVTIEETTIGLE